MRTASFRSGSSMAYPNTNSWTSKLTLWVRQNPQPAGLMATLAVVCLYMAVAPSSSSSSSTGGLRKTDSSPLGRYTSAHWGGAVRDGYFSPLNEYRFAVVTDLDQLSRVEKSDKLAFYSVLSPGKVKPKKQDGFLYTIEFDGADRTLTTKHNEAGRGAEFSELVLYQNRLLTFDDRTGDVFEILNKESGKDSFIVPRFVITEGPGETDKGMKWEWATVKDRELFMGSMGKAYTNQLGEIVSRNNLWIAVLNQEGQLRREDWSKNYEEVRKALHATDPGYVIIEAINWSAHLNKWVVLPRRISSDAYEENADERKGGNKLVLFDEGFTNPEVVTIDMEKDPLRGFSSFAFVPNTEDKHAMAIRSVEEDCVGGDGQICKQRSYFLIFDVLTGKQLSPEVQHEKAMKFEGVEFVDMYKKP